MARVSSWKSIHVINAWKQDFRLPKHFPLLLLLPLNVCHQFPRVGGGDKCVNRNLLWRRLCRVFKEAHVVDDDRWFRENREEDLRQFIVGWIYGGGGLYSVVLAMFDNRSSIIDEESERWISDDSELDEGIEGCLAIDLILIIDVDLEVWRSFILWKVNDDDLEFEEYQ